MRKFSVLLVPVVIAILIMVGLQITRMGVVDSLDSQGVLKNANVESQKKLLSMELSPEMANWSVTLPDDQFLIVYTSAEPEDAHEQTNGMLDALKVTLAELQRAYRIVDLAKEALVINPREKVIVASGHLEVMENSVPALMDYAEHGGSVFFASRFEMDNYLPAVYRNFGINSIDTFVEGTGLEFKSDFLPSVKGSVFTTEELVNSMLSMLLEPSAQVWVTTNAPAKFPLVWTQTYGQGKFVLYNGTQLVDKSVRSLLIGCIAQMYDSFVYPIIGAKVCFVDDFPSPLLEYPSQKFQNKYKRNIQSFFMDTWWPQVLKAANDNGIIYTGLLVETYNLQLEPEFEPEQYFDTTDYFGKQLLKNKGEIGWHGYNHVPFTLPGFLLGNEGYPAWNSIESMTKSFKELQRYASTFFGDLPMVTYVPPSNLLSDEGREMLVKSGVPLKVISPLYTGAIGEDVECFTNFEIAADGMVNFPRITFGMMYTDNVKWEITNGSGFGVFSHFLHPDDIIDEERGGNFPFDSLMKTYTQMFEDIASKYPYMTGMTASDAAMSLVNMKNSRFDIKRDGNNFNYTVENYQPGLKFLMFSQETVINNSGCNVSQVSDHWYSVEATSPEFSIRYMQKK